MGCQATSVRLSAADRLLYPATPPKLKLKRQRFKVTDQPSPSGRALARVKLMDPVSIAGAVGPTLKTLYTVTTTLYTFITSAKKVDKSLQDLNGEVRSLTRVLEDIETSLKDTVVAQTSFATSKTDGAWAPIHNATQDTHTTVEELDKVLSGLGPPGNLRNGFKKTVKQVQLNFHSDQITSIKLRVHWHSTTLRTYFSKCFPSTQTLV